MNAFTSIYTEKQAADYFQKDIEYLLKEEKSKRLMIMLDEIEWISFNTSSEEHWKHDFLPFWQTLRSVHQNMNGKFCFVIAGVNPKCIEEESVIGYDNPLFALITPTFLQPFDISTTREMVRKLGRYMGIKFDEKLYPKIYQLYGGHPFLVRHACSKLCHYEKERPIKFDLDIFEEHEAKINAGLMTYVKHILNILAIWYPEEYQQIIELAHGNIENVAKYIEDEPGYIEHLLGYGIVNFVDGEPKLSIFVISKQLKKIPQNQDYSPLEKSIEEVDIEENLDDIHAEVSLRRNKVERKLRILLKQSFLLTYGKKCMSELLKSVSTSDKDSLNRYSYENVWEHLYFSDLISIIDKNWDIYQKWFGRDKQDVILWLKCINDFRIDAHARSIKKDDLIYLRASFSKLEEALAIVD